MAASETGAGTSVSQIPCARLTPPMRSHSMLIARISDCSARGASSLRPSSRTEADKVVDVIANPSQSACHPQADALLSRVFQAISRFLLPPNNAKVPVTAYQLPLSSPLSLLDYSLFRAAV